MSTKIHILIILSFSLLFCSSGYSQASYQFGILPAVNLNAKFKNNWSVNFKVESRQQFGDGLFGEDNDLNYDYILTDFALVAAKKVGLSSRLAGGYLIRFRQGKAIYRFIQQYAVVSNLSNFRLAHRIVADQTFSPNEDTEYRFRYRLATEIPLDGQSTDPTEFYLKLSNEYLNSIQGSEYDLEIRVIPMLGYFLKENQKVELGLDYRFSSIFNGPTSHRFWTSMNWYVNF